MIHLFRQTFTVHTLCQVLGRYWWTGQCLCSWPRHTRQLFRRERTPCGHYQGLQEQGASQRGWPQWRRDFLLPAEEEFPCEWRAAGLVCWISSICIPSPGFVLLHCTRLPWADIYGLFQSLPCPPASSWTCAMEQIIIWKKTFEYLLL